MTDERMIEIRAELAALEQKRTDLFNQKEPIDAALTKAYNKIKKLRQWNTVSSTTTTRG